MIDLSIRTVRKACSISCTRDALMKRRVVIREKFDGTKLTLYRNDVPWDKDYTKNWIVSYKDNILYKEEFDGLKKLDRVKTDSIGISQYAYVHRHLEKIHHKTKEIPLNSEFFVEFIQNKQTLTRDYGRYHDMYLISGGHSLAHSGTHRIFLLLCRVFTNQEIEDYSSVIEIPRPPILFSGIPKASFSDFESFVSTYENFESCLGGKAEGVVVYVEETDEFLKIVTKDQYDKDARWEKKQRWIQDRSSEASYWSVTRNHARRINESITTDVHVDYLSKLSKTVYSMKRVEFLTKNDKKTLLMLQDDMFLTAKLIREIDQSVVDLSNVAFYPMSGKPVHIGHWKMIQIASERNDKVFLIVSTKDREDDELGYVSGIKMMHVWKQILIPLLPENVEIIFCESPVLEVRHRLENFEKDSSLFDVVKFSIFTDDKDAHTWKYENLLEIAPNLAKKRRVWSIGVPRSSTVKVSGVEMRSWIRKGDKKRFFANLPPVSQEQKEKIWEILGGCK